MVNVAHGLRDSTHHGRKGTAEQSRAKIAEARKQKGPALTRDHGWAVPRGTPHKDQNLPGASQVQSSYNQDQLITLSEFVNSPSRVCK